MTSIFETTYVSSTQKWDEDPLVLACAIKHVADVNGTNPYGFQDPRIKSYINDELREKAESIRKYYSKKFFWANLSSNKPLSSFRQRLCYLLENKIKETQDRDLGIFYKIPWFYEEDLVYDKLKTEFQTVDIPQLNFHTQPVAIRLEYVTSSFSRQAKRKNQRFWFTDDKKILYCILLQEDNVLLDLFKDTLGKKQYNIFTTKLAPNHIDKMEFYNMHKFKIIGE